MTNLAQRNYHCFHRELLPSPRAFYSQELGKLSRPSRSWSRGCCPFHESKSKLSFSVNLDSGGFYCFGCGAKSGDLVAFVRLRYHLSFRNACELLGAWDSSATVRPLPTYAKQEVVAARLKAILVIDGKTYIAHGPWVWLSEQSWSQSLWRVYYTGRDQLTDLGRRDPDERSEDHADWFLASAAWQALREERLRAGRTSG